MSAPDGATGGTAQTGGVSGAASSVFNGATSAIKTTAPEKLTYCMRITNIINAGLLMTSGIITFTLIGNCSGDCTQSVLAVLAFYTVLFAVLLLMFELSPLESSKTWIRTNCGFMYSNRGKALLLLFLATLCFSVVENDLGGLWWFSVLTGIYTAVNGVFACAVVYMNPEYDEYTKTHQPTLSSTSAAGAGAGAAAANNAATATNPNAVPPGADYRFGDAATGGAAYTQYDMQDAQPKPAYGGQTSTPFSNEAQVPAPAPAPAPSTDHPFAAAGTGAGAAGDNPFSNV